MNRMPKEVRLFSAFTVEQLADWGSRLKYFRVVADEFSNSGSTDNLVLALGYDSPETFAKIMAALGLPLTPLTPGSIQPRVGVGLTVTKMDTVEFEVDGVPGIRQPLVCTINGKYVFVWGERGKLKLIVSSEHGPPSDIVPADVASAVEIEKSLAPIEPYIIDPPVDTPNCFCPKYYPHAFIKA